MRDAGPAERSLPRSRRRGNAGKPPTATIAEDWSVRDRLEKKGAKKRSLERWLFDSTSRAHREPREAYRYLRKPSPARHPSDRRGRASQQGGARGACQATCAPPFSSHALEHNRLPTDVWVWLLAAFFLKQSCLVASRLSELET